MLVSNVYVEEVQPFGAVSTLTCKRWLKGNWFYRHFSRLVWKVNNIQQNQMNLLRLTYKKLRDRQILCRMQVLPTGTLIFIVVSPCWRSLIPLAQALNYGMELRNEENRCQMSSHGIHVRRIHKKDMERLNLCEIYCRLHKHIKVDHRNHGTLTL